MLKSLMALAVAAPALVGAAAHADNKPNLVAVLTDAEPQTQLMTMVLSMQSLKQGAAVHILLCGPAGDLALKEAPASATAAQKPMGMSPQGLMKKVMAQGGSVQVCALYLPNKGAGPEVLIDGITAAKPPAMGARLLADNTRIMSF